MKRFLVDNQLPAALTHWIESQGYIAEHVGSLSLAQSPDPTIWTHAAQTVAVIISKDEDFAQMTLVRPEPVSVVWLRFGNCRIALLSSSALALAAAIWARWLPEETRET